MSSYNKESLLEEVKSDIITRYDPLAVGVFGSGAMRISMDSDVDLYVLNSYFFREVVRKKGLVFEVYFAEPKKISQAILQKDVRVIDRFRNSRALYDPINIYYELIDQAKNQKLAEEPWREKTILGGDYDLAERTSIGVEKLVYQGQIEPAVSLLQFFISRVIDLGFRRLNISEYANPRKIPQLISQLPAETERLYTSIMYSDIRDPNLIKALIKKIKEERENLLPSIKHD